MKKLAYAGLGVFTTALAITVVITYHASWWPLVVFAILPDLSFLFGMSTGLERGRLHPRAVPIYNALHRYWVPAALLGVTFILQSPEYLAAGLAWTAHNSFDRSLGFGLRTREGFQRS